MAEVRWGSNTGELTQWSAFGNRRLVVPVDDMLELAPRLYFADFYCMYGKSHYITLVMTRRGSTTDEFCSQHLLPLSIDDEDNNPFLFRSAVTGEMRVAQGDVKVEVLFTENVDVSELKRRPEVKIVDVEVPPRCRGSSTPGGVPKNSSCEKCNIRPPLEQDCIF